MSNWLVVVIIIAALLAYAGLRERIRLKEMHRFAARLGLHDISLHQNFPDPTLAKLAEQLEGNPPARWGVAFSGMINGQKVTIAECQAKGRGLNSSQLSQTQGVWHVMIAWQKAGNPSEEASTSAMQELPGLKMTRFDGSNAVHFQGFLTRSNAQMLLSLAGLTQAN